MSVIGNTALRLDDEQAMLLDYARSFCAEKGLGHARAHLETEREYDPALWGEIVDMGWTGIGLPPACGGAGLGIGAAVPVLESMGRVLMGTPLLSSLLAAQLLRRAEDDAAAQVLASIASGEAATVAELESEDWLSTQTHTTLDSAGRLHGEKRLVADASSARWIVVTARRGEQALLAVVDAHQLPDDALRPRLMIDHTHRAADLVLHGVAPHRVLAGAAVPAARRDYRLIGALLIAAESTGAAAACLDTTVEYLQTRKQFGQLIGSYQALKHPSVDILNQIDAAKSFIYHAATLVGDAALGREQEIACRMAKAQATETLKFAGDRAIQFHGGMGFTWDCDAQLFVRRAQWAQQQFGDAQHHRRELGALLLGG